MKCSEKYLKTGFTPSSTTLKAFYVQHHLTPNALSLAKCFYFILKLGAMRDAEIKNYNLNIVNSATKKAEPGQFRSAEKSRYHDVTKNKAECVNLV